MKFLIYRKDNTIQVLNFKEIEKINHFATNAKGEYVVSIITYPNNITGQIHVIDFNIYQFNYYRFIGSLEDKNEFFVNLDEFIQGYVIYDSDEDEDEE